MTRNIIDTTEAFPALLSALAAGREFPDAVFTVTQKYRVDHVGLETDYDMFCQRERVDTTRSEIRALLRPDLIDGREYVHVSGRYTVSVCMLPGGIIRIFDTHPDGVGMTFSRTAREACEHAGRIADNMASGVYERMGDAS